MTKNSIVFFMVSCALLILMFITFWYGTSHKVEVEKIITAIVFLGFSSVITALYAFLFKNK